MTDLQKKIRPILNNSKYPVNQALTYFKNVLSAGEFEEAINSKPSFRKVKLKDKNFQNLEDIVLRDPFVFTNNLKKELFWLLYNIKNDSEIINQFLQYKIEFEKLFFLCKYDKANEILESVRLNFGENLWTIEMTLLLREHEFGTKANWTELSNLLSTLKFPFYQFFISFFSKRIEENMSFENCISQFQSDFDQVYSDSLVKDFLVFKSLYNTANYDYSHKNLEGVLFLANLFTSIDQYLISMDVLVKLISIDSNNDKFILQYILKIYPDFSNDNRLINIINLLDSKNDFLILKETDSILHIIDEYSLGNFINCIDLCLNKLMIEPTIFELYEIYCKSLINLNLPFKETQISKLVDKVLLYTYNSLLYNSDSVNYCQKLLKYSLTFLSFNIGKQISSFVTTLDNDEYLNRHALISCMSSQINNPRLLSLDLYYRENGIVNKTHYFDFSESFKTNRLIGGNNDKYELLSTYKPQLEVYLTRNLFKLSRFDEVIMISEKYIGVAISPFYYDNILSLLFESYLKTDRLRQAIILTATILSDRVFFTNKFDLRILTQRVKEQGQDNFIGLIEMPILFSSVEKDYELYDIYIDFMMFHDEEYPSRLNVQKIISESSLEKVVYFLKEVCTISTIKYSMEFPSISDAEQERNEICTLLKSLDSQNALLYDKEIADILRIGAVRKALKEVNDGRLFINVESLKKLQSKNIRESFNRYKEIESTTKDKNLIGYNPSKEIQWLSPDLQSRENDLLLDNPTFLAFKSIYIETREKFLFSKEYGLDSCLSTNFRHGSVKNHLRSVFEKLNLITSKNGDFYEDNDYWADRNGLDYYSNYKVQERLKRFSNDIDEYAVYIKDNLIQIQTERHQENVEGMFTYFFNDKSLWDFFQEYKDRFSSENSIIEILYSDLTNITVSKIYENIYKKLTIDINKKYQQLIEGLYSDLKELGLTNQCELLPNILKSSTYIQTELHVIAEWFILNTTSSSSLLEIETIVNASVEYTNKINPTKLINPEITVQFPLPGHSSLIYVFNILFNNIIEHSKLSNNDLIVKVDVLNPHGNYLEIKVTNTISDLVDINKVKTELLAIKNNWNNNENLELSNIEGGSGFTKIKRILLYEAIAKTDKFDFSVNKSEVVISLFLPFKATMVLIDNIIDISLNIFYSKINAEKRLEPIVMIHYPNYYVKSSLIVVFNLLMENIIKHSLLSIEEIQIKIEVLESNNGNIEVKLTNNISSKVDISKIKNSLQLVKENWNSENNDQSNFDEKSGFDKVKQILLYDTLSKTDKFEFEIIDKELSISIFLPSNVDNDEKNSNN